VTQTDDDAKECRTTRAPKRDKKVTRKPDLLFILLVAFGIGVIVTLLLPLAANDTVAAPASELQAGIIIQD
jgi:hypothetical protein